MVIECVYLQLNWGMTLFFQSVQRNVHSYQQSIRSHAFFTFSIILGSIIFIYFCFYSFFKKISQLSNTIVCRPISFLSCISLSSNEFKNNCIFLFQSLKFFSELSHSFFKNSFSYQGPFLSLSTPPHPSRFIKVIYVFLILALF